MKQKFTIKGQLPDLNEIIELAKHHHMAYSRIKKEYTEFIYYNCYNLKKMNRVKLTVTWYCKNKRKDPDNVMAGVKFILDGLVMAQIVENDNWKYISQINHVMDLDRKNPRIEVELEEADEPGL